VGNADKKAVEFASWDEVRAELATLGPAEQLERAKRELRAYLHAYRLAEARKRRRLSQAQVAEAMGVTQGRVSQIEHGELGDAEVDTLKRYAAAIGGQLRLVVDFGDDLVQIA
jgi:predicted XRE-type DNA-binding protein